MTAIKMSDPDATSLEITLTSDELAIVERLGGGAGRAGRDKSAVLGAAAHVLMRLPGDEIIREIVAAKARRKKGCVAP